MLPFWPPSGYVYVTYFLLIPALILTSRRRYGFSLVLGAALVCGVSNAIFFILFPSQLASVPAAPQGTLLQLIQRLDSHYSVIPSGHVSLPFCIAFSMLWLRKGTGAQRNGQFWNRAFFFYFLWAIAIAASTLLTGQHFLIDVLFGLLFGFSVSVLAAATWLSGKSSAIDLPDASWALRWPTLLAFLSEWIFIASVCALTLSFWSWPMVGLAIILISARQHALLILYHDGVHYLVARNRRLNDLIVNSLAGVPFQLPVHMYRALHTSHHRDLGTDADPERVLLYQGQDWNYQPLRTIPLLRQLAGDLFLWNSLRMVLRFGREMRQDRLRLEKTTFHWELPLLFITFWTVVGIGLYFWLVPVLKLLLLWFGCYFTLTQLLQKLRSFSEHTSRSDRAELSCSWDAGLLGRFFIWPYNMNYHREHHRYAGVPWFELSRRFADAELQPGRNFIRHIWREAST